MTYSSKRQKTGRSDSRSSPSQQKEPKQYTWLKFRFEFEDKGRFQCTPSCRPPPLQVSLLFSDSNFCSFSSQAFKNNVLQYSCDNGRQCMKAQLTDETIVRLINEMVRLFSCAGWRISRKMCAAWSATISQGVLFSLNRSFINLSLSELFLPTNTHRCACWIAQRKKTHRQSRARLHGD